MIKKLLVLSMLTICCAYSNERVYINDEDLERSEDSFKIHTGDNVWIETNTLHRDETGLYTIEDSILRSNGSKTEYQKKWKCPYCYQYWPIGTKCQNKDCPSKYK